MVRNFVPNGKCRKPKPGVLRQALKRHLDKGYSVIGAARSTNIPYSTFRRYVINIKKGKEVSLGEHTFHLQVFTNDQEKELHGYLVQCSNMCFGISPLQLRKLAYELAMKNKIRYPKNWDDSKCAGKDWFTAFMKRHKLSLRQPENCSLARAISFNPYTVANFFSNLKKILDRDEKLYNPERIFNLDETGTTTVPGGKTTKVIALKGIKQVNQLVSQERGTLVTTCCIVNAAGHALPPAMVFPRVKFNPKMLTNSVPGTLGLTEKSGWMTAPNFVHVLRHFINHTKASKDNPMLLIYDNHESHLSVEGLDLAKNNGVTILTLPPHTSHRMQPLDVGVFSAFRAAYDNALNAMMAKLTIPLTIYEVAECVKAAFDVSMTKKNIKKGFSSPGICPFNPDKFKAKDYGANACLDKPAPLQEICQNPSSSEDPTSSTNSTSALNNGESTNPPQDVTPVLSSNSTPTMESAPLKNILTTSETMDKNQENILATANSTSQETEATSNPVTPSSRSPLSAFNFNVSPADLHPAPKARRRNPEKQKREPGRSFIATDTPEKKRIEEKKNARALKAQQAKAKRDSKSARARIIKRKDTVHRKKQLRKNKALRRQLFQSKSQKDATPSQSSNENMDGSEEVHVKLDLCNFAVDDPTKLKEKDFVLVC